MRALASFSLIVAAALLGACAGNAPREEPHHYSTARDGSRTACYTTATPNEYECLPMNAYYRYPYYDPFWPRTYPWGFYPDTVVLVVPGPPPRPHFTPR